ncbi:MAG: hypothetical protein SFY66_19700 [Oculatellaceae cyanobacterium bins.114]|nr:hypothetical protein [Oculatellaceae cyanobacterium bins.114]
MNQARVVVGSQKRSRLYLCGLFFCQSLAVALECRYHLSLSVAWLVPVNSQSLLINFVAHHANRPPNSPIDRLIRRLLRWMRRSLGVEQPHKPSGIIEARTERATLWRAFSDEPGVCSYWQICHEDASSDLAISIISVAQLREDLGRGSDRLPSSATRPGSKFKDEFEIYLKSIGGLDSRFISHIFVVAWRSRIPRKRSKAGERPSYLVRPIAAIPGDFQGISNAWASGDRYAIKIAEVIAKRLLRMTPTESVGWEEIINGVQWLDWLEFYAARALGKSHVFQPRRNNGK